MILNIRNSQFNWFDNPYISPNIYDLDQKYEPKLSKNTKFKKCEMSDLAKFMDES